MRASIDNANKISENIGLKNGASLTNRPSQRADPGFRELSENPN